MVVTVILLEEEVAVVARFDLVDRLVDAELVFSDMCDKRGSSMKEEKL